MTGSTGWITMLPTRFAGSFTNCAGYGCPNIPGVQRHRRHLDGTPVTPDRPAIYATYAIYGPPMLSAEVAVNTRFSSQQRRDPSSKPSRHDVAPMLSFALWRVSLVKPIQAAGGQNRAGGTGPVDRISPSHSSDSHTNTSLRSERRWAVPTRRGLAQHRARSKGRSDFGAQDSLFGHFFVGQVE
jgi:hypothetical protein